MKLFTEQRDSIFACTKRLNIWDGAVRSGKSVASVIAWLKHVMSGPRGEMYMIGKTVHALKRNIIGPMQEMLGPEVHYSTSQGLIKLWGRKVHVLGANDERSEGKIRGSTSAGTYGDELSLWPENFFKMSTSRMSVNGAKFIGTTNPDSPNHWLKKDYLDRAKEIELARFQWSLESNKFLSSEYIDAIKREYTGLWKLRFIDGKWVLAEGAIYDMFHEDAHTFVEQRLVPDEYIVGVDYGTTNPCVFVLIGISHQSPKGPICWAEREYYYDSRKTLRQKTDAQYADDMLIFIGQREHNKVPVGEIFIDPSAASFKLELSRQGAFQVTDADNDVANGIRTVGRLLHQGRFTLHRENCPRTVAEFPGYVWDAKKSARGKEEPIKSNDHGMDAIRYPLQSRFGQDSIVYSLTGMKW